MQVMLLARSVGMNSGGGRELQRARMGGTLASGGERGANGICEGGQRMRAARRKQK